MSVSRRSEMAAMPLRWMRLRVWFTPRKKAAVTTEYELCEQISAPVSKGQQLGTVTVRVGQQVIRQYPLVAADTVPKLTWGQLVWQVLRLWCGGT